MNKGIISAIAIIMAVVIGGFIYFSGKEYIVRLSETQIQEKLEKKLPLTKTYLFVIEVTLNNPRVKLEEGSERVKAGLDVEFNISLGKNKEPLGGTVDVSGSVRYEAEKAQFFLDSPIIENLKVQGIPQQFTSKANKALAKALVQYYKVNPIYTLRATDIKKATAKMVLKKVVVENKELVITLGI